MPRGDKSSYSAKQKRQAEHIEESEREQGRSRQAAARIAWATVNKQDGGAKGAGARKATKKVIKKSDGKPAAKSATKKAVKKSARKSAPSTSKQAAKK